MKGVETQATVEPKISHAALLTSAQLVRGMGRMVFVLVVARLLGPREFGVYALLFAVVEMLSVASGSGYADYLTREAAKDARAGWGLAAQLMGLRLACTFPLIGVVLGILWALKYPHDVLASAVWLSLILVPRSFSEVIQGVLRGVDRYVPYFSVDLIYNLTLLGGVAILFARGSTLGLIIALEIISAVVCAALALIYFFIFRTSERKGLGLRQLLQKSAIFNIYAFVGNLYDRLDVVLLSKLAGDYATGIYNAAYRPLGTLQLVPYGILYSLLPSLSRNVNSPDERRRLERAMGLLLSAAFVVVLTTMVFAGPAVRLVLGPRYADSAVALEILIWAVILRYINYGLNVLILAGGHERLFVVTTLACLAVNVIGNLLLIPRYSWRAAAALTIVTEFVMLAQNIYWLYRILGAVPRPLGWTKTSLIFTTLLALSLLVGHSVAPLAIGTISILIFMVYIYRVGMFSEFAAAWGSSAGLPWRR